MVAQGNFKFEFIFIRTPVEVVYTLSYMVISEKGRDRMKARVTREIDIYIGRKRKSGREKYVCK